jgi:hypothetical protein
VSSLGEQILAELGQSETTDTLTRWMSHRIAEVLTAAGGEPSGQAASAAKREAEDAILRLWSRRHDWPNGWPPAGAASVLLDLERRAQPFGWQTRSVDQLDTIEDVLMALDDLNTDEKLAYFQVVLESPNFDTGARWLANTSELMSGEEREALESVSRLAALAQEGFLLPRWLVELEPRAEAATTTSRMGARPDPFGAIDTRRKALRKKLRALVRESPTANRSSKDLG